MKNIKSMPQIIYENTPNPVLIGEKFSGNYCVIVNGTLSFYDSMKDVRLFLKGKIQFAILKKDNDSFKGYEPYNFKKIIL